MHSRVYVIAVLLACSVSAHLQDNQIDNVESRASDSLLSDLMDQCISLNPMTCIRERVLLYLDNVLGSGARTSALPDAVPRDEKLDSLITERVSRLMRTTALRMQLPDTLFQSAILTLRPANLDLDVQFPIQEKESRAMSEARGILKKKLLLPILLLLKLKMKALMPILVLLSSIKALKALVISKIALLVVAGFAFLQVFKKLGGSPMPMPMMPMMPTEMPPAPAYGAPPAPQMPYSPPAPPTNSYGPAETSWEPSPASSNSYSKVYDAHQLAYKGYYTPESTPQAAQ